MPGQMRLRLRTHVRSRECVVMPMSYEEIETLRRSCAFSSPSRLAIDEVIETALELARRQRELGKMLSRLGPHWPHVRTALNDMAKVLRD
ncbi:MAG: hypothetical protein JWM34_3773 [Ilumatobacteraceae bacterium]|nr:hypothetical protein [Ilumatobacteraceae bacterium]